MNTDFAQMNTDGFSLSSVFIRDRPRRHPCSSVSPCFPEAASSAGLGALRNHRVLSMMEHPKPPSGSIP